VPAAAQPTSTRIGSATRAPSKNSADRARSTLAPGGNTPPIVRHRAWQQWPGERPAGCGVAENHEREDHESGSRRAERGLDACGGGTAGEDGERCDPAQRDLVTDEHVKARAQDHHAEDPRNDLNPANAPIRAAARRLLGLRGLPINPISVDAM
jgi:hypothetical protein